MVRYSASITRKALSFNDFKSLLISPVIQLAKQFPKSCSPSETHLSSISFSKTVLVTTRVSIHNSAWDNERYFYKQMAVKTNYACLSAHVQLGCHN